MFSSSSRTFLEKEESLAIELPLSGLLPDLRELISTLWTKTSGAPSMLALYERIWNVEQGLTKVMQN
ncbi:hypothetical protein SLS55_003533 [Diplodia seriata]|uniref:Uncharacterized protein n=1 Tax=Diplodia seriata TaxID=420778 RepID=A0ABR3CNA3_9PEZI